MYLISYDVGNRVYRQVKVLLCHHLFCTLQRLNTKELSLRKLLILLD